MLAGFAAAHDAWRPQLLDLAGTDEPTEKDDEDGDQQALDKKQKVEEEEEVEEVEDLNGDRDGRQEEEGRVVGGEVGSGEKNAAKRKYGFPRGSGRQNGRSGKTGAGVGRCVLVFDNRGVGRSSVPKQKKSYT